MAQQFTQQLLIVAILLVVLASLWHYRTPSEEVCAKDDRIVAVVNNHVLVQASFSRSVFDGPVWFLLDTGSSALVLDKKYAERIESTPAPDVWRIAATKEHQRAVHVSGGSLYRQQGPPIELPPTLALVQNLQPLYDAILANNQWQLPGEFGGILGFTSIKDVLVRIDYPRQVVKCTPQVCLEDNLEGLDFRLTSDTNFAVVRAKVHHQEEEWIIDTGSALTVHNVRPQGPPTKQVLMIDGPIDLSQQEITLQLEEPQGLVGHPRKLSVEAWVPHQPMKALEGYRGCIGSDVLKHYRVSICYRSGKIRLEMP